MSNFCKQRNHISARDQFVGELWPLSNMWYRLFRTGKTSKLFKAVPATHRR